MNIKSTIMACVTFLIGIAIVISYVGRQDRYAIMSQDKAVFVFDRQNATLNYCTANDCQLITPHAATPEMAAAMSGIPSQMAIINGQAVMVQAAPTAVAPPAMVAATSLQSPPMMLPQGMQPMMVATTPTAIPAPATASKSDDEKPAADDKKDE